MTLVNSLENNFEQPNTRVAEPFPLCLERPLGAVVSQSGTQFAIWAPTAEKITLRLFSRGSKGEDGCCPTVVATAVSEVRSRWIHGRTRLA